MKAGGLATWEFNQKNQMRYWSPEAAVMHGFPRPTKPRSAERNGAAWFILTTCLWSEPNLLKSSVASAITASNSGILRPDGEVRWTAVHGTYLHGSDTGRVIGVLQDITERKSGRKNCCAESEARLRELLATIDLAAVLVHANLMGEFAFGRKDANAFTAGQRRTPWAGCRIHCWTTVFPVPLAEIEATLIERGEWYGDVLHRRRDGSVITMAMHKVLRRDADGQPIAILENLADVTALRKMEADLRALNHELEDRVRTEVAAREAAQTRAAHAERIQALGELAGGIAHDFNNILYKVYGRCGIDGTAGD